MILRIQGPTKFVRVDIPLTSKLDEILPEKFNTSTYKVSTDEECKNVILTDVPIQELKLQPGQYLYIHYSIETDTLLTTENKPKESNK
ncbi:hypothetical protein CWI39_1409p0020, partial [Hamiltosporidium magnivora]